MRSRAGAASGWVGKDGRFQQSPEIKGPIRSGKWIPEHAYELKMGQSQRGRSEGYQGTGAMCWDGPWCFQGTERRPVRLEREQERGRAG